ncbi:MAG: DUF3606 domain-containing protein [Spirochaetia bacterium]|nr:DUF3606 domain-containing protein [Spirochaetia bacterium]MDY4768859.1 DUF3606 domain-containing protein [Treponema sp.]MEE1248517.1 DUF3606 domain-containing protein [Lachnospiraceae bacterium]MCI6366409.1 DUF3606 domain-containing protein [Spirochaetia bacterium]MCI7435285.1 DUF3606 domain-containing protein [Spirochaetia bacterium]
MDNLNRRVPEDPQKININQSWEVEYWTKKLLISEKKLRALVAKVGVNVADVKKELQQERNYSYSR